MDKALLAKKAKRVHEIQAQVASSKDLYQELDHLVFELKDVKGLENFNLQVVDNFAEKNTVFKPAGVRRFEFKALEKAKKSA